MISLAFFATVINYLDRQTLSVAAPILREQFHMTNEDYSRVVSAFLFAYTIMNGLSGPMIDRLGTRLGYGLCVAWWSIAAALHAFARGALSLGVFRFLLGIGEAGNWPGAVKVVAEWFPEKERALAAGLFNSGSAVGAILAPPIVAYLILHIGWQAAFAFIGLAGSSGSPSGSPCTTHPRRCPTRLRRRSVPVRQVLSNRFVWAFTFSKIFMDPVWYFYIFWFPEYLKNVRGFDLAKIGNLRLDSIRRRRLRQHPRRLALRPAAQAGLLRHRRAQRLRHFLRRAHDLRDPRRARSRSVDVHRLRLHRHARLHRLARQHAQLASRRLPEVRRRQRLRHRQHGLRLRRHAVHPDHRLRRAALLLHARLLRLRHHAPDLRDDPVDC